MSLSRLQLVAGLAALAVYCTGLPVLAQGVPTRGRAIQFSDPKVEVVTSNLNQAATSRKSSLRNLDDQFKAPFNIFDSANGVGADSISTPFVRQPILNSRSARELKDKKTEQEQWIFGSPEELEAQRLSAERMFGLTEYDENGAEKTSQTPFQRYWDRMDREHGGQTNRIGSPFAAEKSEQEIKDQAKSMFGIHNLPVENAGPNQAALGNSSLAPTYANSFAPEVGPLKSSSELFSTPAAAAFLPQKNEAAVSRMNEFKQLLDIKTSGAGMTEFKQLFDTRPSGAGIAGGLGSSPALVRPSDFATPSASIWRPSAAPVSGLNSLSGPSVAAPLGGLPGSSLNTATLPGSQAPKFTTPPAGFQLPKRSF